MSGSKLVKLKLIEQLLSRTQNITSLSADLEISVQTFKRYLSEIQKDVEQLNYTLPIVFTDAVTCSFRAEKGSIDFDNIAKLRLSYVKTSLPFQICSLFIQSHTPTINDVAEKLYVSTSQIYKSIKKLNTILSLWNISVTVGKHQHLVLSGNELNIRVFLYHFISHFPPMENQRLKHNFSQPIFKDLIYLFPAKDLSTDSLKKLTLIFYILEQRLLKKQFVDPISSTLFTTFEFFSYIPREFIESFLEVKQVFDSNTQYYEYLYLNFFIRLFVPDVVLEENILEKGIRLTHPKDEREQFIFNLQKTWENTFNVHLTKEKQYTLLYTSALLATLIYFSPIDLTQILKIETLYTKKEQEFSEITLFIDDFLFKSNLSEQDKNLFREKKESNIFLHCIF